MEDLIPSKYNLGQNYPNPFKDKTTIKYCIPDRVKIKLEILDSDKHTMKTIIDDIKDPGTYEIEFSAKGGSASGGNAYSLPSGIYFYRLQASDFVETKKMILLK